MEHSLITSTLLAMFFSSFCVIGFAQTSIGSADLEATFKIAFTKFKQAVATKDAVQLKEAMASTSYMKMKNQGIAYKMDFPKDFFEGMGGKLYAGLDLTKFKILKAAENNNTGMLLALAPKTAKFDPFEMGGDAQAMLFTISFIKEAGVWKFSEAPMEPLAEEEETKLLNGDLSKLNDARYKPSGIVAPTPAEESAPDYDYDAVLNIIFGQNVEVTLNGKTFINAKGSSASRTGVKQGENTIVIKNVDASSIKITIRARKNDQAEPVLVFDLDIENPEPVITKTFQVDFE